MFCPNCEAENKDGAKFCNECGFPLSGRIAAVTAAANADREHPEQLEEQLLDEASEHEADAPVQEPHTSGPLDPDLLPHIDVAGVNVDEDGKPYPFDFGGEAAEGADEGGLSFDEAPDGPGYRDDDDEFDFRPIGEDDDGAEVADGSAPTVRFDRPGDKTAPVERVAENIDDSDLTRKILPVADGEESLVDGDYVPPAVSWRTGDTMEMPRVPGEAAPAQKEFRAPDANGKPKSKHGKIIAVVLAALLVAAGAAAFITYRMELWGGKEVPEVVGMTQADASYLLEGKGFTVRAMEIKSDDTEGLVLLSDPGAGMRAPEGSEIVIHVAISRTIPEIIGMAQNDALALLASEGYENVTVTTQKSNEEEGSVLAVTPEAGSKAKAANPITVTVAQAYTVPNVTGQSADAAEAALQAEGYQTQRSRVYTEDVTEGTAVSTDPAAGTKLASGSTVTVYIARSRANELIEATYAYLVADETVRIGGTNYQIRSLDGVEYAGNNTTTFTMTAQPYTSFLGETVYLSARTVTGQIVWDDNNNVVSIE